MVRRIGLLALGAVVGLGLAACGDGDSPNAAAPAPSSSNDGVTVIAEDISLSESMYRAEAGSVAITYRNDGSIEHTLVIEGVDGFKLDVPANGDVDEGSVDLQPGEYTIYCDVAGHRDAGMEATLEVA
jgi:plastocyanin